MCLYMCKRICVCVSVLLRRLACVCDRISVCVTLRELVCVRMPIMPLPVSEVQSSRRLAVDCRTLLDHRVGKGKRCHPSYPPFSSLSLSLSFSHPLKLSTEICCRWKESLLCGLLFSVLSLFLRCIVGVVQALFTFKCYASQVCPECVFLIHALKCCLISHNVQKPVWILLFFRL